MRGSEERRYATRGNGRETPEQYSDTVTLGTLGTSITNDTNAQQGYYSNKGAHTRSADAQSYFHSTALQMTGAHTVTGAHTERRSISPHKHLQTSRLDTNTLDTTASTHATHATQGKGMLGMSDMSSTLPHNRDSTLYDTGTMNGWGSVTQPSTAG